MNISDLDCISCGLCCYFPSKIGYKHGVIEIGEDGWCIHHEQGLGCKIHHNKPIGCELFIKGGEQCLELRKNI